MGLEEQIIRIKSKIKELRNKDSLLQVFGNERHRYKINSVLEDKEIVNFEKKHHIKLPEDYRLFISKIGNGLVGSYYGLTPLIEAIYADLDRLDDNFLINLSLPFPHKTAWNIDFKDVPEERLGELEKEYFDNKQINGLLRVCNYGCGVFISLVVNGDEYGNIWFDDRCSDNGIYPYKTKNKERFSFLDWYEESLDKSLEEMNNK